MSTTETSSCLFVHSICSDPLQRSPWSLVKAAILFKTLLRWRPRGSCCPGTHDSSGEGSALNQGKAGTGKALVLRKCSAMQWHSTSPFAFSMGCSSIQGRRSLKENLKFLAETPWLQNIYFTHLKPQTRKMYSQSYLRESQWNSWRTWNSRAIYCSCLNPNSLKYNVAS